MKSFKMSAVNLILILDIYLTIGSRPLGLHVLCVGFDERGETYSPSIFLSKASGAYLFFNLLTHLIVLYLI